MTVWRSVQRPPLEGPRLRGALPRFRVGTRQGAHAVTSPRLGGTCRYQPSKAQGYSDL